MITPPYLKIIGVVLSLVGTVILAIRVTQILSALSFAVRTHDLNFQIRGELARGNHLAPPVQIVGADTHVDAAERLGVKLLVLGFLFQVVGGACTAYALWLE